MASLLFIRHAETDLAGRFCGHSDPPVNASGRLQIEGLKKTLAGKLIDEVYTSDLFRALTTAGAVAEQFGLLPILASGLREISFGAWEGMSWQEIEESDSAYAQQWLQGYPNLATPGGESFAVFQARVLAEVKNLLSVPHQRVVAVVTHAGVMRVVLRSLCGFYENEAWERTKAYCSFFLYQSGGIL